MKNVETWRSREPFGDESRETSPDKLDEIHDRTYARAAGAMEALACAKALKDGIIHRP
jgi:hypothetical protein